MSTTLVDDKDRNDHGFNLFFGNDGQFEHQGTYHIIFSLISFLNLVRHTALPDGTPGTKASNSFNGFKYVIDALENPRMHEVQKTYKAGSYICHTDMQRWEQQVADEDHYILQLRGE